MLPFLIWLEYQDSARLLALLEARDYFEPATYNSVFQNELEKLAQAQPVEVRKQVMALRDFDFANYIARSLVRAGFRGDDVQENFHNIVVKLLLSPGKLFRGWNPHKHGPLDRRFRQSVWNAIRNALEKRRNYRKWMLPADPTIIAHDMPSREPYSGVLDDFRRLVANRLGDLAAAVLDWRMQGQETKDLVARADLGRPSIYLIKREVGEIKKLAHRFAAQSGDAAFLARVERALEGEAATVARRMAARGI